MLHRPRTRLARVRRVAMPLGSAGTARRSRFFRVASALRMASRPLPAMVVGVVTPSALGVRRTANVPDPWWGVRRPEALSWAPRPLLCRSGLLTCGHTGRTGSVTDMGTRPGPRRRRRCGRGRRFGRMRLSTVAMCCAAEGSRALVAVRDADEDGSRRSCRTDAAVRCLGESFGCRRFELSGP